MGESFRPLVPVPVVWASYGVATAYVTADAIDKGRKAATVSATPSSSPSLSLPALPLSPVSPQAHAQDPTRVGVAVVDTFVWQSLASVAIPGFTINRLCAASLALLGSLTRWPLPVRRWTTTALGLAAIPLIITPIDRYRTPLGRGDRREPPPHPHSPEGWSTFVSSETAPSMGLGLGAEGGDRMSPLQRGFAGVQPGHVPARMGIIRS